MDQTREQRGETAEATGRLEREAEEVDTSLGGLRARRVLDRIASEHGPPEAIVLDNGPEFRGRALAAWCEERGLRLEFIEPGKPAQNAFAESFNGRLRNERLNASDLIPAKTSTENSHRDWNSEGGTSGRPLCS